MEIFNLKAEDFTTNGMMFRALGKATVYQLQTYDKPTRTGACGMITLAAAPGIPLAWIETDYNQYERGVWISHSILGTTQHALMPYADFVLADMENNEELEAIVNIIQGVEHYVLEQNQPKAWELFMTLNDENSGAWPADIMARYDALLDAHEDFIYGKLNK